MDTFGSSAGCSVGEPLVAYQLLVGSAMQSCLGNPGFGLKDPARGEQGRHDGRSW